MLNPNLIEYILVDGMNMMNEMYSNLNKFPINQKFTLFSQTPKLVVLTMMDIAV